MQEGQSKRVKMRQKHKEPDHIARTPQNRNEDEKDDHWLNFVFMDTQREM